MNFSGLCQYAHNEGKMLDQHLGGADLNVFHFCNSSDNDLSTNRDTSLCCYDTRTQWNAYKEKDWGS